MTIYAKISFFIIIFLIYTLTYVFERNNSTRAIQKILIFIFLLMMTAAIIAPSTFVIGYANLMGVSRGPDAVLYLFIVVSLAINFILFKKVSEAETRISKLAQSMALLREASRSHPTGKHN